MTESLARKQRSEEALRQRAVPINPGLPPVQSKAEVGLQTPGTVARRCVVLYGVVAASHGSAKDEIRAWFAAEGLDHAVSPWEARYFRSGGPDERADRQATWRVEAIQSLLWALQEIPDLDWPGQLCDVPRVQQIMPWIGEPTGAFISRASLRPAAEILDALDLTYRIHWAVREAQRRGQPPLANVNAGVVLERHHALNWLVGYGDGEGWDDVPTDT